MSLTLIVMLYRNIIIIFSTFLIWIKKGKGVLSSLDKIIRYIWYVTHSSHIKIGLIQPRYLYKWGTSHGTIFVEVLQKSSAYNFKHLSQWLLVLVLY